MVYERGKMEKIKEKQISTIVKSLRYAFLFLMVYPFVRIIQNFISSDGNAIGTEATVKIKVITCAFAGFVIYYLFTDRKKWGLSWHLFIITTLYLLTLPAGAFLNHLVVPVTFSILEVLLLSYGIAYLNTKQYKTFLIKMNDAEFKGIYLIKKTEQKGNFLNGLAMWALVLIPFIGLGAYFLAETKSPLVNTLVPVLAILLIISFLIVGTMAIVNLISSVKQLITKKKNK